MKQLKITHVFNYQTMWYIYHGKKKRVAVFVHKSLIFKLQQDLSHSDKGNESIVIEIINKHSKNTFVGTTYRPPNGKMKPFKKYFQTLFDKNNPENKIMYLLGDYNLNVLDYSNNTKVKNFLT